MSLPAKVLPAPPCLLLLIQIQTQSQIQAHTQIEFWKGVSLPANVLPAPPSLRTPAQLPLPAWGQMPSCLTWSTSSPLRSFLERGEPSPLLAPERLPSCLGQMPSYLRQRSWALPTPVPTALPFLGYQKYKHKYKFTHKHKNKQWLSFAHTCSTSSLLRHLSALVLIFSQFYWWEEMYQKFDHLLSWMNLSLPLFLNAQLSL